MTKKYRTIVLKKKRKFGPCPRVLQKCELNFGTTDYRLKDRKRTNLNVLIMK